MKDEMGSRESGKSNRETASGVEPGKAGICDGPDATSTNINVPRRGEHVGAGLVPSVPTGVQNRNKGTASRAPTTERGWRRGGFCLCDRRSCVRTKRIMNFKLCKDERDSPESPQWQQRAGRNENKRMPLASRERRLDKARVCTTRPCASYGLPGTASEIHWNQRNKLL